MAVTQGPDLVLLDMQLPVMDGFEVLKAIKNNTDLSSLKIIAVTSLAMAGDRERILEAGADGYVAKPIDTRELPKMVKKVLGLNYN